MLGFFPKFKIDKDWSALATRVTDIAINYVHNNKEE